MKKSITLKLQLLLIAALCLLTAVLFLRDDRIRADITRQTSSVTGGADERFQVEPETARYPLGTTVIPIQVTNVGSFSGEFNHPELDAERDGVWYRVEVKGGEQTANLLFVYPGETKEFFVPTYDLPAGHYRAVFRLWGEDGWFAYEFELY